MQKIIQSVGSYVWKKIIIFTMPPISGRYGPRGANSTVLYGSYLAPEIDYEGPHGCNATRRANSIVIRFTWLIITTTSITSQPLLLPTSFCSYFSTYSRNLQQTTGAGTRRLRVATSTTTQQFARKQTSLQRCELGYSYSLFWGRCRFIP